MTRETKLGLVVAGSFLALVGGVVVARLKQVEMPGEQAEATAVPAEEPPAEKSPPAEKLPEKIVKPVPGEAFAKADKSKMPPGDPAPPVIKPPDPTPMPPADPMPAAVKPPDPAPMPPADPAPPVIKPPDPTPAPMPPADPAPQVIKPPDPTPAPMPPADPAPPVIKPPAPMPPADPMPAAVKPPDPMPAAVKPPEPPKDPAPVMTPAPAVVKPPDPVPMPPADPLPAAVKPPDPTPVAPIPTPPDPPPASPPAPMVKPPEPTVVKQPDPPTTPVAPPPLNPNVANNAVPTVTVVPASGTNGGATLDPPRTPAAAPRDQFTQPAPRPAAPPEPKRDSYLEEQYRWKGGDSFAALSTQYYQSPKYADALLKYNQDYPLATREMRQSPPAVAPGQVVWVPPVRILERDYANRISGLTPVVTPTANRPTVEPVAPPPGLANSGFANPAGQFYRVRATGESVQEIARRTQTQAVRVQQLNPTLSPDTRLPIPAGTVLRLPAEARVDAADKP